MGFDRRGNWKLLFCAQRLVFFVLHCDQLTCDAAGAFHGFNLPSDILLNIFECNHVQFFTELKTD